MAAAATEEKKECALSDGGGGGGGSGGSGANKKWEKKSGRSLSLLSPLLAAVPSFLPLVAVATTGASVSKQLNSFPPLCSGVLHSVRPFPSPYLFRK